MGCEKKMASIWIIGFGKFGQLALKRLSRRYPDSIVGIVDKNDAKLTTVSSLSICADGASWLENELGNLNETDLIVPAVPVHFAFEWVKNSIEKQYHVKPVEIYDNILQKLPNPIKGNPGRVYASHATFICPDNCPEPDHICTHTGEKRPPDLFKIFGDIRLKGIRSLVLQSRQLCAGVGGYTIEDLKRILSDVNASKNKFILMSTACRCHGVADLFEITKSMNSFGKAM